VPPMLTHAGRKYPVPKANPKYDEFHKTPAAKVHAIYEEGMLESDDAAATALAGINAALKSRKGHQAAINSGHDAAAATIARMARARRRLAPMPSINADDPSLTVKERGAALWKNKKIRTATIALLADSVQVLADLWEAAWRVGNGNALAASKRREYTEDELQPVYRKASFLKSTVLNTMASSGRFEPPAAVTRRRGPR